jgi:hypothetical protein
MLDWIRIVRHHDEIGISPITIPWFAALSATVRIIELIGGLAAVRRRGETAFPMTASPR